MKFLILGEISLDTISKSSFQSFSSIFAYRSNIFESQIAAITPKKHTTIILKPNEEIDFDADYDVILIFFKTGAALRAYEVADTFRKKDKIVILSGNHPSVLPEEAKPHADSIIIGVAEKIWPIVVKDLEEKKLKPIYESKDLIDFPRIPPTASFMSSSGFKLVSPIEATRGCPDKCDFCQYSNVPDGSTFFSRPVEDVIAEIKTIPQKLLYFKDLSMTIKPAYSKELFKKMKGLNKKFICHGNLNVLARDEELIKLSHDAGCIEWIIGFESFSQDVLKSVNKNSNKVKDFPETVKKIQKYKMIVDGTFVFGFDDDTPEVFNDTLNSIDKLGLDSAIFAVLTPYPGTPIFDKLEKEGRILTHDWSKYNRKNVVFKPKKMTKEELEKGYIEVTKKYNSVPRFAYRVLNGFKRGFYPALLTLGSNLGSYMASINK
jgi:radical SAM superfamily enzyme YgiQ (UPF0313 family)